MPPETEKDVTRERLTIPAAPSSIARELEPIIERVSHTSAEFVLSRLEGRLTKIEHALELSAKHNNIMYTELMGLKLRLDKYEERLQKLEAKIILGVIDRVSDSTKRVSESTRKVKGTRRGRK